VTEGVQPTIEEMRSFSFGDNDEITGLTRRQFMMFKKGDRVKVVEGFIIIRFLSLLFLFITSLKAI
jgi:hypothetical protein